MNPVAFYDTLNCMSSAVLAAECGDAARAETALLEASLATPGAFPPGSREADALAVLLAAAAQVQEAVS